VHREGADGVSQSNLTGFLKLPVSHAEPDNVDGELQCTVQIVPNQHLACRRAADRPQHILARVVRAAIYYHSDAFFGSGTLLAGCTGKGPLGALSAVVDGAQAAACRCGLPPQTHNLLMPPRGINDPPDQAN